jgi:hypothetical protein
MIRLKPIFPSLVSDMLLSIHTETMLKQYLLLNTQKNCAECDSFDHAVSHIVCKIHTCKKNITLHHVLSGNSIDVNGKRHFKKYPKCLKACI